jgi:hypothetical protein
MGGYVVKTSNRQIVRRLSVNRQTLEAVARALGITDQAELNEIVNEIQSGGESIYIYAGTRPTP